MVEKHSGRFCLALAVAVLLASTLTSCLENSSDILDSILNSKIEFDTPQDGDTVSGIVNIAGIAAGMKNVSLRFKDSGGELLATETATLTGTDWEYSWDTSSFSDGPYTIRAYGDGGGSLAFATITVNVQNNASENPELAITYPQASDELSGTVTLFGTLADQTEISIEVIDDGDNAAISDYVLIDGTNWSYSLDTTGLENGSYTIKVTGNVDSAEASVTVTVQNTAPEEQDLGITITEPADNATVSGTLNISGTASGPVHAFKVRIERPYSVIEQFYFNAADKPNWSCSFDTTAIDNGDYIIRAMVWDASSNVVEKLIAITVAN
jgi:hypothetical protein